MIPPDHMARLVWEFALELDMTSFYEKIKSVEGHPGRPAIDPRILAALWMYATTVRGLKKVKAVVLWYVLVHNLLRTVSLRAQQAN